jgi:hypothetical protein
VTSLSEEELAALLLAFVPPSAPHALSNNNEAAPITHFDHPLFFICFPPFFFLPFSPH